MSFLIFSLTETPYGYPYMRIKQRNHNETKEKFLPALSSHTGKPCLLLLNNCKACLYQRITWRFRHITSLFHLKISDFTLVYPRTG